MCKKCVYNVDKCVIDVYNIYCKEAQQGGTLMKQRDLIKKLEAAGFEFKEHGGNHDTYKRGFRYRTGSKA